MKYLITTIIVLFGFNMGLSQNVSAHKLFEKYEDAEGFTSVLISEYAFELFADVTEGEEQKFQDAAKMITGLRILTADNSNKAGQFLVDMKKTFKLNDSIYKPLMTVKSDDDEVLFYLREQQQKIKEFVLLVQNPESPVMILIEGDDIDLKKLKGLAGNTDIDALNEIGKMK